LRAADLSGKGDRGCHDGNAQNKDEFLHRGIRVR
jgi:hypothetical protein